MESKQGKITFETRKAGAEWEALIHQRARVWLGDTEEAAIANMLNGVAQLSASGSIDPDRPDEPGPINGGPVQMCIELLERKLARLVADSADAAEKERTDEANLDALRRLQDVRRTIGNIGTALAALCRVGSN